MIGETVSHYKILEKIGGGGMGVVYKAQDTRLDRSVALKFLPPGLTRDPEARERFIHEAKAASALQHANICTVHDIGETEDGQLFIVMDCYDGETLKKKIERGPFPIEEAVAIAIQVAQGLSRAHEASIVHRDIKPANLMVTKRGEVKIVDFGLAKLSGRTVLTKTGSTVGTVAYMSPEQARSETVDARTDVWSLGVVLYEMLTGKKPFESEYEQALVYSILSQDPKPMKDLRADVPEALEKICRRAMAKDRTARYQTAAELIADLESFKGGTRLSQQTRKALSKKSKLLYAGLAAIVITFAIVIVFFAGGKGTVFDRVAVLPFRNISKDTTGEILAQGMMEDIILNLQQVASLKVPESRSTMKFRGSQLSLAAIAGELDAKVLVDGSIQLINNRIHVIVKLIEPTAERVLWTEQYDDNSENILSLQKGIAQALVKEVRAKVTQAEQERLGRPQKPVNLQAYELYLRARHDIERFPYNPQKTIWDSSIARLRRAIDAESDNARYYAALVGGYEMALRFGTVSSAETIPKMKVAAETALRLDAELAEAHLAAAQVDLYQCSFKSARSEISRALELSPGSVSALLAQAMVLVITGELGQALAVCRRAQEIDPVQFKEVGLDYVGEIYFFMRRYDDAIASLRESMHENPKSDIAHAFLSQAYSMKGMHKEALAHNDSSHFWGILNGPFLLVRAGERALAAKAYERNQSKLDPYLKAVYFAALGEKDSAFHWLQRSSQDPNGDFLVWIKNDPFLDTLRGDPRFKELLKKMNLLE